MKKFLCAVLVVLFLLLCGSAFGKGENPAAKGRTDELKRMSVFLSNFTEAGFVDFDMESMGSYKLMHLFPNEPYIEWVLAQFGILHNAINNFRSRVKKCGDKNCPYGSLTIDGRFVVESVQKYFGVKIRNVNGGLESEDPLPCWYDGKQWHFFENLDALRDGPAGKTYYAEAQEIEKDGEILTVTGELYNAKDKDDCPATFAATVKPQKWRGKDTWVILSLERFSAEHKVLK